MTITNFNGHRKSDLEVAIVTAVNNMGETQRQIFTQDRYPPYPNYFECLELNNDKVEIHFYNKKTNEFQFPMPDFADENRTEWCTPHNTVWWLEPRRELSKLDHFTRNLVLMRQDKDLVNAEWKNGHLRNIKASIGEAITSNQLVARLKSKM